MVADELFDHNLGNLQPKSDKNLFILTTIMKPK